MSPIKGLSERRVLPRLGKIHLGIRHAEKGYPIKTDYFVCPPEVQKVFGEKPKELRILIPLEDEEKWASQYYRCYSKTRGLVCKGDGETAMQMTDKKIGAMADSGSQEVEMREVPCRGRECPDYKVKCKEVMNLQFLLPEVPGLGVWQIDTGSINGIKNINSMADLIKAMYGRIHGIPLLLTLEPREVNDPKTGKKQTVFVMHLRTNLKMADVAIAARQQDEVMMLEMPTSDDEPADSSPEWDYKPLPPRSPEEVDKNIDELWGKREPKPCVVVEATKETKPPEKPQQPKHDPATIKNFGDLYKACADELGLKTRKEVWDALKVFSQEDITMTPQECYTKLAAERVK